MTIITRFKKTTCMVTLLLCLIGINAKGDNGPKTPEDATLQYSRIITKDAISQTGLFEVHQVGDKVYFEIPDSLLGRDMLMGARIAQVSDPSKAFSGEMRRNPILIKFNRDEDNVYLLQEVLNYRLVDQSSNIRNAFDRNSILPVFQTFPIKAFGDHKQTAVIDVTDFFSKEIDQITPFASKGKPGTLDAKASSIANVQVFNSNIEIQTYLNYSTKSSPFRALVNRSLLLLPKEPMVPRLYDRRINYFSSSQRLFADNGEASDNVKYINRFRVEPKPEDRTRYFSGELVEPAKPIIVYVDNGLPERWRKYVKQGIEDWQKAFEAIGFRNAIIAKDFPDDPEFNPNDLRYTCFRYITNATINAMGPRWTDPRSGEIIRGDVIWYHNVIQKLHDWRLVQCAAVEEEARQEVFSDELMGRLIRYAASHEIGHVLGFQHNMRASYAYPVDSLRSASFTQEFGTTPSIMDYARFNYIAQPGDKDVELTPPTLGVFDFHTVKMGYQLIEDVTVPEDEYPILNKWLLEKAGDPFYQFNPQFAIGISSDPSAQAEALGDDAIRAGIYGLKNMKFIMKHLVEWCTIPNEGYDYLERIYKAAIDQYFNYLNHATSYLGGAYQYLGVEGEDIPLYTPVSKDKQREAISWIINELANSRWLLEPSIEERLGSHKNDYYKKVVGGLDQVMSGFIFQRIETYRPVYSSEEYLADMSKMIWAFSNDGQLTETEMVLQQAYVHNLISMSKASKHHVKRPAESKLVNDWLNQESALTAGNAAKINYVDHFVVMASITELERARQFVKKQMKGRNKAHYTLLYKIITSNILGQ